MRHAILAHLAPNSSAARKQLRLAHLEYMNEHKSLIVAGGPTLSSEGEPLTMILLTHFESRELAQAFLEQEPYSASGRVFERTEIFPWSLVLPEQTDGDLSAEILREKNK